MSTKYKATELETLYFITCTVVEWIDLFTRLNHKQIIVEALEYCQKNKDLDIYGWCLMPSHLHLICSSDTNVMSNIMRDFKTFTSKKLLQAIREEPESRREWLLEQFSKCCEHLSNNQNFKVWQNGYHAKEIVTNAFAIQKLNYLHENPVKEGIVECAEDYVYSSARDYSGLSGKLKVELLSTQNWQTVK